MDSLEGLLQAAPAGQLAPKCKIVVLSDWPNTFGTAGAAQRYHSINATHGFGKDAPGQPSSPDDLMAQLNNHFDNLTSAATNSNTALEQLATATTYQYTEIKVSLDALDAATPPVSHCTIAAAQPLVNAEKRKL